MTLKNTKAEGVDKIPVQVLKMGAPNLAWPISHLVRQSFRTCQVPQGFKLANLTPLHKGKGKATTEASS